MKKTSVFAMGLSLVLGVCFLPEGLIAQEQQKHKTHEWVMTLYKSRHWYEMRTYPKEDITCIRQDPLGCYVIGPGNFRYYIDEASYHFHKYDIIRCMEAVRIEDVLSKCESIDQVDRVRVATRDGNYWRYKYFPKNQIRQDDLGYHVESPEGVKYYLDSDKTIAFPEQSPTGYLFVEALLHTPDVFNNIDSTSIHFPFGSSEINPQDASFLRELAIGIGKIETIKKIKIVGHTDSIGSSSANRSISHQRARNVLEFLVDDCGLDEDLFLLDGVGEGSPVESNNTELGRSRNRRVEFEIME